MEYTVRRTRETTGFQTPHYAPDIDLRADVVFVYGWSSQLPERVATWRSQGYRVHFMTGCAWGRYDEYLGGQFDGRTHYDEAQVARNGERLDHGNDVFYIVPTASFTAYLKALVERAIDADVDAVHLEEPEFWTRGGYSDAFKTLWKAQYGTPWEAPHTSPTAWYRAAALKYQAFTACLDEVFQHAKTYAERGGRTINCYVDSHSLVNYAQWGIVSPASNLAHLTACDGYVCQVWTGTARTPNHAAGVRAERTFETAYLEYGQMASMVNATGRRVWFLADPIEDDPRHDWADYRSNYHATLVASLLFPEVSRYEIMPWPSRVFNGRYPHGAAPEHQSKIAPAYATELLTIANALTDMEHSNISYEAGPTGIGICVSDTLLFERGWDEPEQPVLRRPGEIAPPDQIYRLRPGADPEFDSFFGLTLPLLAKGIPIRLAHLEHAALPGYLDDFDVLVLSYDAMKPPHPLAHEALAEWVRRGGVLIGWGSTTPGPFDAIDAWWSQMDEAYSQPAEHLWALLGIERRAELQRIGDGGAAWIGSSAAGLAHAEARAQEYAGQVQQAYTASRRRSGPWRESGALVLRRGPYVVAATLSRPAGDPPTILEGLWIDLFDADLRVRQTVTLAPGQYALLYDLRSPARDRRAIIATGRVEHEAWSDDAGRVVVSAPRGIAGQLVLQLPACPERIEYTRDHEPAHDAALVGPSWEWDERHRIARIRYHGTPDGVDFTITLHQ